MKVIFVNNAHQALSHGLHYLDLAGMTRDSRNGPVRQAPVPVTTVYRTPQHRVIFWPQRDANPFFHLYESLWMLAGRNDVASLARYVKRMMDFSDNGTTIWGAYGDRWRNFYEEDQLEKIAYRLKKNKDDRRCVLQMWDASRDLGVDFKDVPCNTIGTFQIDGLGKLCLTVFCRSNDIIMGAYGANCVHFTVLQEFMANWIGVEVGEFNQVSVNWHAYVSDLEKFKSVPRSSWADPYLKHRYLPIEGGAEHLTDLIRDLLEDADLGLLRATRKPVTDNVWIEMCASVLRAHEIFRTHEPPVNFLLAKEELLHFEEAYNVWMVDWIRACWEWIDRRHRKWSEGKNGETK